MAKRTVELTEWDMMALERGIETLLDQNRAEPTLARELLKNLRNSLTIKCVVTE